MILLNACENILFTKNIARMFLFLRSSFFHEGRQRLVINWFCMDAVNGSANRFCTWTWKINKTRGVNGVFTVLRFLKTWWATNTKFRKEKSEKNWKRCTLKIFLKAKAITFLYRNIAAYYRQKTKLLIMSTQLKLSAHYYYLHIITILSSHNCNYVLLTQICRWKAILKAHNYHYVHIIINAVLLT